MLKFMYGDGRLYRTYRVLSSCIVMEGYIGHIGC